MMDELRKFSNPDDLFDSKLKVKDITFDQAQSSSRKSSLSAKGYAVMIKQTGNVGAAVPQNPAHFRPESIDEHLSLPQCEIVHEESQSRNLKFQAAQATSGNYKITEQQSRIVKLQPTKPPEENSHKLESRSHSVKINGNHPKKRFSGTFAPPPHPSPALTRDRHRQNPESWPQGPQAPSKSGLQSPSMSTSCTSPTPRPLRPARTPRPSPPELPGRNATLRSTARTWIRPTSRAWTRKRPSLYASTTCSKTACHPSRGPDGPPSRWTATSGSLPSPTCPAPRARSQAGPTFPWSSVSGRACTKTCRARGTWIRGASSTRFTTAARGRVLFRPDSAQSGPATFRVRRARSAHAPFGGYAARRFRTLLRL